MMCIYKHCFLPMLLVFAMKCCTTMPCPLPHNHYCCLLPSPISICLPHLLICTSLISSPIACLPSGIIMIICVMLMSIAFFYFCYMLHFFVTPFWLVCVHIFSFVFTYFIRWWVEVEFITFSSLIKKGSGYRYACGPWNLKTYSYTTCDVTVTHDESALIRLGRNELNVEHKPKT